MTEMIVDYELKASDYDAFVEERRRLIPPFWSQLYYYGIMPVLAVALALAIQSFPIAIVFTILYVLISWLIQKVITAKIRKLYSEKNLPFSIARWRATLTEAGIELTTDAGSVIYRWQFIKSIGRSAKYIHFVLTPMQQLHIPVRSFKDESEMRQFLDLAQSYVKRHTS